MSVHSPHRSNWLAAFFTSLFLVLLFAPAAFEQQAWTSNPQSPQAPASTKPSGMSTGGAYPPVKDAKSRPITAGGFVDGAPVIFADITKQSGLDKFHHRSGSPEKSTILDAPGSGVALLDYDNDGWLDIYLVNGSTVAAMKGAEPAPRAALFHNNHDGTFTDVAEKAGVANERWGFAVAVADYDNDGWPDLAVANDSSTNYLYRNRRDGAFEDVSYASGFALSEEGRAQASMGIALGDYNRDGKLDLFVPTFSDDNKTLYRNDGYSAFTDVSFHAGIGLPTIPFLSWGAGFLDFDNDGLLDLFIANGHVYPVAGETEWGTTYAQRPLLFRNIDGKKFQEVPAATGSGLASIVCARGAAFGDLFNDGHIDVVLNNIDSTPTLLRNVTHTGNHWLGLKLIAQAPRPVSRESAAHVLADSHHFSPSAGQPIV